MVRNFESFELLKLLSYDEFRKVLDKFRVSFAVQNMRELTRWLGISVGENHVTLERHCRLGDLCTYRSYGLRQEGEH